VGSEGNRLATKYFTRVISSLGWKTEVREFDALDWEDGGAELRTGDFDFEVFVSPYSQGCSVRAPLVAVSSLEELARVEKRGKILFLFGGIAREQLMPKNFVFYNPEEHQKIISLLEKGRPGALVCATGRNPALAGGVYPFPLIEDGDFDIPSVYMTEEEGKKLLPFAGKTFVLKSDSRRIPGKGYNVVATKGKDSEQRVVVTAHIDAKKGTPGAIDNATGVVVLLLLAELLEDYTGEGQIELAALNGEDYYSVPGQMLYTMENKGRFKEIILNINIDGAGYKEGNSVVSFYNLPDEMRGKTEDVLSGFEGIAEGAQWFQGDHSIFIQKGCPALAVTSQWFVENMQIQNITHTPKDHPDIVDCRKLVEIAEALSLLVR
jgi:aminopeptidase YwaD